MTFILHFLVRLDAVIACGLLIVIYNCEERLSRAWKRTLACGFYASVFSTMLMAAYLMYSDDPSKAVR